MALVGNPDRATRNEIANHMGKHLVGPLGRAKRRLKKLQFDAASFRYVVIELEETTRFWLVKEAIEALIERLPDTRRDFERHVGKHKNPVHLIYQSAFLVYQILLIYKSSYRSKLARWRADTARLREIEDGRKIEFTSPNDLQEFALKVILRPTESRPALERMPLVTKIVQ